MAQRALSALIAILFITTAYASTKLLNMWVDPAYKGKMKNVLVVGVAKPGMRQIWENIFVYQLGKKGIKGTASFEVFADSQQKMLEDTLRQKVKEGGYDGVILTTGSVEAGKKYEASYIVAAPTYAYTSWYSGYAIAYDFWRQPAYEKDITNVRMETTVWDATPPGKMIWSGTSQAVNVKSAVKVSEDITGSIISELSRKKIL
jgi:hypothetical protein